MWCCYNMISFLPNVLNRHPIAQLRGEAMGCVLWVQTLINVLPWSLQWWTHYWVLWHRKIQRVCNTLTMVRIRFADLKCTLHKLKDNCIFNEPVISSMLWWCRFCEAVLINDKCSSAGFTWAIDLMMPFPMEFNLDMNSPRSSGNPHITMTNAQII